LKKIFSSTILLINIQNYTKTKVVFGLLKSCHLEHVFGERSFTPNIAERFLNRLKNKLISK